MNRAQIESIIPPFVPERDSVIYRKIIDFADYLGVSTSPRFEQELAKFAIDVETALQAKLKIELNKPPQPFTDMNGKTWIYVGPKS